MKILFTGASSFTGFWFVKTLAAEGHEIVCPITKDETDYSGVRGERIEKIKPLCRFISNAPFGSENFRKIVAAEKSDLLCHHAADVTNYKSPDFDTIHALQNNSRNLRSVLKTLNCPVVLTGSVFENDEGKGDEPLRAFSPYGLSKALTFQMFRFYCAEAKLPLGKFVIPNPFGPFEEPRFTAHLMKNWRGGKVVDVKTPDYVRDNIHVELLAAIYAKFAADISKTKEPLLKINPSGYVEKQGAFAERIAREVRLRTNWECELNLMRQTDFNEPLNRVNTEPAAKIISGWNETKAWDTFVEFYAK